MPDTPETIHVVPAVLGRAAAAHKRTSDYLAAVPGSHGSIQTSVDSLGAIYHGLQAAAQTLLTARKECYEGQAEQHGDMSEKLDAAVRIWDNHEQNSSADFRRLADGL